MRLPIKGIDYPSTMQVRETSYGKNLVSGLSGQTRIWRVGPYIISHLYVHRHGDVFWGVEYPSKTEAIRVFAAMSTFDDEVKEHQRGYALRFYGDEAVRVENLDSQATIDSLIRDYSPSRSLGARGRIFFRPLLDREDIWLVVHEDWSIAAYHQNELEAEKDNGLR